MFKLVSKRYVPEVAKRCFAQQIVKFTSPPNHAKKGLLIKWHVSENNKVSIGDPICQIETLEKEIIIHGISYSTYDLVLDDELITNVVYNAPCTGTIVKKCVEPGGSVMNRDPLLIIDNMK